MEEFEKTLKKTAKQSGVSVKGFDFFKVYSDIAGHVRNERYSKIPSTLYSIVEEAYPKNEKFLSIFKGNIEKMFDEQQIVNSKSQPHDIIDNKPRSYLNNTTADKQIQRSYHVISSRSYLISSTKRPVISVITSVETPALSEFLATSILPFSKVCMY